ncbi:MAG: hypothetical protein CSA15_05745 [Candidatus Delongbacteria bacterium]|nr:MAG: hypothetical protein CSA15_05745 [Candidatus Delongbacteria bacterium]
MTMLRAEVKFSKDKNGDIVNEKGQTLLFKDRVITDSKGNEYVLDHFHNETGLTIPEFIKHKRDYLDRISEILEEKKLDINDVFGSISRWYEYKVNLDKLEELKEAGFDALPADPKVKGIGGKFEASAIASEAIIVGKVVKSDKPSQRITGYRDIYIIKVDEIIKNSKNISINDKIRCGLYFRKMAKNPPKIGEKRIFVIRKVVDSSLMPFCPLLLTGAWKLDGGIIKGKPNGFDDMSISLVDYKKRVEKLIKINNADNFFKRSWKKNK